MKEKLSRLERMEGKRNRRSAFLLLILTIALVAFMLRLGPSLIPKFTDFLRDLIGQNIETQGEDVVPPSPPIFDELPEFTKEPRLVVIGSAEEGSLVSVKVNDAKKEVVANASGRFSSTFDLKEGENVVVAMATDRNHNKSGESESVRITYDTKPPELVVEKPINGESFFGTLGKQKTIEGHTEKNATVTVNDRVVVVARDGRLNYPISLNEGENVLKIIARDLAGNETLQEIKVNYTR